MEYYEEYVSLNTRKGNRHLINSLTQFKLFINSDYITPIDITENFCKRFRQFLLDKYTGETPGNYYSRFKWVVNAASKEGYFHQNPTEKIHAKSKPSRRLKANLEVEEYLKLLQTPCSNEVVKSAFVFCCYTGLRVDVKKMEWEDLEDEVLTTRLIQAKTGQPVMITLHPIAVSVLTKERNKAKLLKNLVLRVFSGVRQNALFSKRARFGGLNEFSHEQIRNQVSYFSFRVSRVGQVVRQTGQHQHRL